MTTSVPDLPVPVPVRRLAGDATIVPVWLNDVGGVTYRIDGPAPLYVKWQPPGCEIDLLREVARLDWAGALTTVPEPVEWGEDDTGTWLVTRGLPGTSAVSPEWLTEPEIAVRAVGLGLRALHERLPISSCPWEWSVAGRIAEARDRGRHPDIGEPPTIDRLVVCHGDACCPNTLLAQDGTVLGHVDLGSLGVADRWADIAVAAASTRRNYGPGWEDALVTAYGLEPDRDRMDYYQRLWDET
ncbi:aminoglycoside 3'-phosphotransferase [Rhodococcus rhodnii]|uniref:Aminoglycoside phosphotransferase domain-containing protein n=2 Tax=Rhodococcus rhodnii TaxID=38312 RepID=R7WKW0_9NOCA|nr:aminoglycoside 3'-phosphotransferase [Rhodococcus rhodnii]EOM75938.1 hypothetical protein Rrhod_2692 [Rhodococcus rhodnii LMG 5362]TXG90145.1 aminoglycoside 3'-phosphotransferase [Rhodococcus rhodnii]